MITIDKISRSRRRTLAIIITAEGKLEVRAPTKLPMWEINKFILKKTNWILKKQSLAIKRSLAIKPKQFIPNEQFLFLGKHYNLTIANCNNIQIENSSLILPKQFLLQAEFHLTNWYKTQAIKIAVDRLNNFASSTGLKYTKLRISNAKTRWGSCNRSGCISINWRLVMSPLEVFDYVIVHELTHTAVRNHSKEFWDQVKMILSDYKLHRQWLKNNGNQLYL